MQIPGIMQILGAVLSTGTLAMPNWIVLYFHAFQSGSELTICENWVCSPKILLNINGPARSLARPACGSVG